MAHRVNPKIFRIGGIADWDSRWLSEKNLPKYLEEDFKIRTFLKKNLKDASVESIEIERFSSSIKVIINSARPGLIIGRGGEGVEKLKKALEKILKIETNKKGADQRKFKIDIKEVREPWSSANLACQWIAQQIEKRVSSRRVTKQSLEKIMACRGVEGARVELAGRLMGAEIARREWLKRGCLPRQTIRAKIDYGQCKAHCAYGVIGIKVWIYKGERFENEENEN